MKVGFESIKEFFQKKFFDSSRVKVPTILQMEATECGAASLAMILAHYGLWIPLEKLRQDCGVNRDGSNAKKILVAARNLNCTAKAFTWSVDKIKEKKFFPLIIHWEFNHFVVLEGFKADTFFERSRIGQTPNSTGRVPNFLHGSLSANHTKRKFQAFRQTLQRLQRNCKKVVRRQVRGIVRNDTRLLHDSAGTRSAGLQPNLFGRNFNKPPSILAFKFVRCSRGINGFILRDELDEGGVAYKMAKKIDAVRFVTIFHAPFEVADTIFSAKTSGRSGVAHRL